MWATSRYFVALLAMHLSSLFTALSCSELICWHLGCGAQGGGVFFAIEVVLSRFSLAVSIQDLNMTWERNRHEHERTDSDNSPGFMRSRMRWWYPGSFGTSLTTSSSSFKSLIQRHGQNPVASRVLSLESCSFIIRARCSGSIRSGSGGRVGLSICLNARKLLAGGTDPKE